LRVLKIIVRPILTPAVSLPELLPLQEGQLRSPRREVNRARRSRPGHTIQQLIEVRR
jgi:hypothetical protein